MMHVIKNNLVCLLCLLLMHNIPQAQYKNKAMLGPVTKTGFYSLAVTPELSSYVKTDFSDLRVVDGDGKQAEYVLQRAGVNLAKDTAQYKPLPIIQQTQGDSGKSILVLDNAAKEKISSLVLLLGNASISRMADVSGSDDGKQWFSMVENISLEKKYITDTDRYAETVIFPTVQYRYIRLVMYNGKNDPLHIIAAGRYVNMAFRGMEAATDNPPVSYTQKDSSDGYSYIRVHNPLPFHVDNISLQISGPKFFKRDAVVVVPYGLDADFTLSSNTTCKLTVPVFATRDWLLKIFNGDNPPLKISGIGTSQQKRSIITWLNAGKTYHLEMNYANAIAPQYDLQNFKDSIPADISPIAYGPVEALLVAVNTQAGGSFFKQSWLWAVIIAILAGLLFFTWQLTKEVGKKG
jgi:hypothetical protein